MYYADSNFIFMLYKELSGIEKDVSVYQDFFMEPKNVGHKFKDKYIWPKDSTWNDHIEEAYAFADEKFKKFVAQHIPDTLRNKFPFTGPQNEHDIPLSLLIYIRFMLTAKEKWNNNFDRLKKIVLFYCHIYRLNPDYIAALKELDFANIISSLITEASTSKGVAYSKERGFSSLLDYTKEEAKWLEKKQCKITCNSFILKLIAHYHFLKDKLQHLSPTENSAKQWEEALLVMDELIYFVTDMLDIYTQYLPEVSSQNFAALPNEMCIGDKQNLPAFCGELYLIKARLLLDFPSSEKEMSALLRLNHAKKCLLDAEEILSQCLKIEECMNWTPESSKDSVIKPLLGQIYLNRVRLYCKLAIMEQHECRIDDLCHEYIKPGQKALLQAEAILEASNEQFRETKHEFLSVFFEKNSIVFERIVSPEFSENPTSVIEVNSLQNYKECANSVQSDPTWIHSFQFRVEKNDLDLHRAIKTAYSADFDSVLSKSPEDSGQLELSIFQIVASGITIVLQLNQITDNIAMLKLLHNPAFQVLCRKGMIVLSCYNNIMTPEKYLLDSLQKEIKDFEFSSSKWFNHPKFGMQYRDLMSKCLTEQITYSHMMSELPDMIKNDLDFCYDSYRLLLELFTPSTIRQFHQNPAIRYPQVPLTSGGAITLSDAIYSRIQDLREDDAYYPIDGRQDFLDFCTLQHEKAVRAKYTTRSEYRNLIPEKEFLKQMTPQYQNYWNWFESLINYSYCASNGSRSSDHIYNTLTHDILRLHPEQSVRNVSTTDNLIIKDAFTRYRNENLAPLQASHIMSLSDLIEISMIVRRYNLENLDSDKRQDNLEKNTGMKYDTAKSGDALLVDYKYRTENRVVTDVTLKRTSNDTVSGIKDGIEIQL